MLHKILIGVKPIFGDDDGRRHVGLCSSVKVGHGLGGSRDGHITN